MNTTTNKPLVLFLCTGNSARSQLAEAILRAKAGDRFDVASAGTAPRGVHPMTVKALAEIGLPTDGMRSKPSSDFLGRVRVTYAIIVCGNANTSCPTIYPFAFRTLFWPFEDPASPDIPESVRMMKFREVRARIGVQIDSWLAEHNADR